MPSPKHNAAHYVAPLEETPLLAVDQVAEQSRPSNLWRDAWRDLRGRWMFWLSAALLLLIVVVALFPTLFTSALPNNDCLLENAEGGPTPGHPLGFTALGCDIFARTVHGTSTSLSVGVLVTLIVAVLGLFFGTLAGFYGGWVDAVLSRIGDIFFSIPYILAAVVVMSALREFRSVWTIALAVGLFSWPAVARVLRAEIMRVKNSDFVMAAEAIGVSRFKTMLRHVLPNAMAPVIVILTISLASAIVAEATLSFLGVGLPSDVMSWGNDIGDAQRSLRTSPMTLIYPSIALSLTVLAFIMMGESIREALDPKARARR